MFFGVDAPAVHFGVDALQAHGPEVLLVAHKRHAEDHFVVLLKLGNQLPPKAIEHIGMICDYENLHFLSSNSCDIGELYHEKTADSSRDPGNASPASRKNHSRKRSLGMVQWLCHMGAPFGVNERKEQLCPERKTTQPNARTVFTNTATPTRTISPAPCRWKIFADWTEKIVSPARFLCQLLCQNHKEPRRDA